MYTIIRNIIKKVLNGLKIMYILIWLSSVDYIFKLWSIPWRVLSSWILKVFNRYSSLHWIFVGRGFKATQRIAWISASIINFSSKVSQWT